MGLAYYNLRIYSQTYITTNHGEVSTNVASDISNGYVLGEGRILTQHGNTMLTVEGQQTQIISGI